VGNDARMVRPTCSGRASGIFVGEVYALNYGTPPYTFYLMPGPNRYIIGTDAIVFGPTANRTVTFNNVAEGTWTVAVYDSAAVTGQDFSGLPGLFSRGWGDVTSYPPVVANFNYQADDSGLGDGVVSVDVVSGIGPFELYLNDFLMPSSTFSNLRKGAYSLRVVDTGSMCSETFSFEVTQPCTCFFYSFFRSLNTDISSFPVCQ
jgi:hypothetical protein